ncbi:MAG: ATP synthase F1 subunit delta [Pyrinomonadaceae bacterium]
MSIETIARRYGSALADVVLKTGETETVSAELLQWEAMLSANAELSTVFANPAIQHQSKERVLEDLIERAKPLRTTANFLRVLLRNGRLTELPHINRRFAAEIEERRGIVAAEVTSARELRDDERGELKSNLEKLTGRQVKLNFQIDNDLIGGVVARIGSTVYDGSVKTKLENLRQELIGS